MYRKYSWQGVDGDFPAVSPLGCKKPLSMFRMGFPLETFVLEVDDQLEIFLSLMQVLKTRWCFQSAHAWSSHVQRPFFSYRDKASAILTWSWEFLQSPFMYFSRSVMGQVLFQAAGRQR